MGRIYFLRHGRSLRQKLNVFGRRFDASLDPDYFGLLEGSAMVLRNRSFTHFFSSRASRCVDSLRFIFGTSVSINVIAAIDAFSSGVFEDRPDDWVREHFPEYYQASYAARFITPQFGEESVSSQIQRVLPAARTILDASNEGDVLVSTHCSVINIFCGWLMGISDETSIASGIFNLREGEYLIMDPTCGPNGGWGIESTNSAAVRIRIG